MAKKVIVVGGGASGLVAAIEGAKRGHQVTLLERLDRVGKKILAAGNGRCNLWNVLPASYRGDDAFAQQLFLAQPLSAVEGFFASLGLITRLEEGGRVYPASGHGASALDVLRLALERYRVNLVTETAVTSLKKEKNTFVLKDQRGKKYHADKVILSGGGKASSKLGSNGSAYNLLTQLGHRLTAQYPALVPLDAKMDPLKGMAGVRVRAELNLVNSISHPNPSFVTDEGEVLFTATGLSGIAAMSFGEYFSKGGVLTINFLPAANIKKADLLTHLFSRRALFANAPAEQFFTGVFHKLLGFNLLKAAGISPLSALCSSITDSQLHTLKEMIFCYPVAITGTKGFDQAQVTAGGIDAADFSPTTMESQFIPGLYATGEVLNVHGPCGGYNLLFAFTSGLAAARNI